MTEKEILEKLEKMHNDPKSAGFMTHLLYSYFPVSKAKNVIGTIDNKKFKCSITNVKLTSLEDLIDSETLNKSLMINTDLSPKHPEASKEIVSNIQKITDNNNAAITGLNTDTFLSVIAFKTLINWVSKKILSGDVKFNKLIEKINNPVKNKNVPKRNINVSKKTTLGDLSVLQELKKKFNK